MNTDERTSVYTANVLCQDNWRQLDSRSARLATESYIYLSITLIAHYTYIACAYKSMCFKIKIQIDKNNPTWLQLGRFQGSMLSCGTCIKNAAMMRLALQWNTHSNCWADKNGQNITWNRLKLMKLYVSIYNMHLYVQCLCGLHIFLPLHPHKNNHSPFDALSKLVWENIMSTCNQKYDLSRSILTKIACALFFASTERHPHGLMTKCGTSDSTQKITEVSIN